MRKLILLPMIVIAILCIATIMISCKPSDKEQVAQENVDEAKKDLAVARKEANQEEWQNFKNDVNATIEKNEIKIAQLKEEMKAKGNVANAEYERKVDTLKAKNQRLKNKLDSFKEDKNADWQSFKAEFNHDMNEIGDAFKDLTVDNK